MNTKQIKKQIIKKIYTCMYSEFLYFMNINPRSSSNMKYQNNSPAR